MENTLLALVQAILASTWSFGDDEDGCEGMIFADAAGSEEISAKWVGYASEGPPIDAESGANNLLGGLGGQSALGELDDPASKLSDVKCV